MRAALAQFIFESNTFAPREAEIDLFKRGGVWLETEAAVRAWARETDSQMRSSLKVLESVGWETNPSFAALDALVELLAPLPGVYGARLFWGGFGGAVMALTDGDRALLESEAVVKESYARKFGTAPRVFQTKPGDGAGVVSR